MLTEAQWSICCLSAFKPNAPARPSFKWVVSDKLILNFSLEILVGAEGGRSTHGCDGVAKVTSYNLSNLRLKLLVKMAGGRIAPIQKRMLAE